MAGHNFIFLLGLLVSVSLNFLNEHICVGCWKKDGVDILAEGFNKASWSIANLISTLYYLLWIICLGYLSLNFVVGIFHVWKFMNSIKHHASVASRRNLGTTSPAGVWSSFLNTSKILLIHIVLHTFSHFFLAVQDVLVDRTQGNSLFTWEIYRKTTIFFFSSSF